MKRILAFMMVCVLLSSMAVFAIAENDNSVSFTATLTDTIDSSAKQWFATDENRALLSLLLTGDILLSDPSVGALLDLTQTSYVGKSGTTLIVFVQGTKESANDYCILYLPMNGQASYIPMNDFDTTIAATIMESICEDSYYKNDRETIAETAGKLADILSGN